MTGQGEPCKLEVKNLKKVYGRKVAVKDISFAMKAGDVVGLLGPNGAGKTTVFYMIVGFIAPSKTRIIQGPKTYDKDPSILLDGSEITRLPMYKRAQAGISYLPQEVSIFRKMTVEQNIMSILETRRDLNRAGRLARLDLLLDEFGIDHIRKQYAYTLSGGERRRTEIARALAIEPKFLLLDEPFAGIDPKAVQDIKQIVQRLSQSGIGILITDHNARETLDIAPQAFFYIIADGLIIESGDREAIIQSEKAIEIYLGKGFLKQDEA